MAPIKLKQVDQFKARLVSSRKGLLADIAMSKNATKPVSLDQTLQGRVSRGDALQQQEMAKAGLARNKSHLQRVQRALKRIESDDYGYCESCGNDIAPARLEIMPDAEFCIACTEKMNNLSV